MREVISRAIDQGGKLRVKSALNPALWMCGIISLPIFLISTWTDKFPLLLQVVASAPIFVTIFGFLFLLFFDRDKLQSEEFQIQKKSLEIIEQSDGLKIADASQLKLVTNPKAESES